MSTGRVDLKNSAWMLRTGAYAALALVLPGSLLGISQCTSSDADGDEWTTEDGDCDDSDSSVHPGAPENCTDGKDNDCDGSVDEIISWYLDYDGDGYGDSGTSQTSCEQPSGYVEKNGDCDDGDPTTYPSSTAFECVDEEDHNCNGVIGKSLTDGGSLSLDVPSVPITFNLTLGGAAISTSNTSATDYGSIKLRDVNSGKIFKVLDAWNTTSLTPVSSATVQVVPGVYDIYYGAEVDGPSWPDNTRARLQTNVTLKSTKTVTVDIPVVTISFSATLNGAALSTSNTGIDDEGQIEALDTVSGDRFKVWSFWNDDLNQLESAYSAKLVPGTYDLYYAVADDGPHWPANENALLKSAVSLSSSQSMAIDVKSVNVATTVTLNSAAVSSSNSSADDEADILFRSTANGDSFKVMSTWNDAANTAAGTQTVQVIPGTYDILYSVNDDGPYWPSNKKAPLKTGASFTSDGSVSVNVSTITVKVSTTLNSSAISSSNGSALDEGGLRLRDTTTGEDFSILSTWNDTTNVVTSSPFSVTLIPGTFDLYYSVVDDGAYWPSNERFLLKTGLVLTSSQDLKVNVSTVDLTVNLTLDGQSISSSNTGLLDEGAIELRDTVTDDRFTLFSAWNDTTNLSQVPFTGRIIPGTYDIYFVAVDDGAHWPGNQETLLKSAVTISSSQSISLNVPVSSLTFSVSLNGTAVSSSNTTATDEGDFYLADLGAGSGFSAFSTYDDTALVVNNPFTVQMLPGTYAVRYSVKDDGPNWPAQQDYVMDCFTLP